MSRYAYLTCEACNEAILLGKEVSAIDGCVKDYYLARTGDDPMLHIRLVNRYLANHSGHKICVLSEEDVNDDLRVVGDDGYVSIYEYTKL